MSVCKVCMSPPLSQSKACINCTQIVQVLGVEALDGSDRADGDPHKETHPIGVLVATAATTISSWDSLKDPITLLFAVALFPRV